MITYNWTSIDELERVFFPNDLFDGVRISSLCLIDGYNTICPGCGRNIEPRYYGQPKLMRCPKCEGKRLAERVIKNLAKEFKEVFDETRIKKGGENGKKL